ncbi:hypothetical protein [Bacillus sp. USDA818B3_A]|uniref:hypothetical protein n=1 Tax=Bacillus sp. USDA818B3_A TaxID=2698834 RepID=UPI00136E723D|nr:hypothetical protein [Bacillus sp. USDA818B3_A]
MKIVIPFITLILLFALTACSNEDAKDEQNSGEAASVSSEENKKTEESKKDSSTPKKVELKEYSFDEFVQLSEDEQKGYFKSLANNLGYTDALGDWMLSLVKDPNTQIPSSVTTVSGYAEFYVKNAEIQDGYKLNWKLEEEKEIAKNGTKEEQALDKRAELAKKEPLFAINDQDQISFLGIGIGDSIQDVVSKKWGEPNKVQTDTINGPYPFNKYFYGIPGDKVGKGLERYWLVIDSEYGGSPETDTVVKMSLLVDNKPDTIPNLEIPKEFSDRFIGDIYYDVLTGGPFDALPDDFDLYFFRDTEHPQGLTISTRDGNDFDLEAQVWPIDELSVFEKRKSNYDVLTMKQAQQKLTFEEIKKKRK